MAVLFCGTLPAVSAEEAPIEAAPVPRRVLALHDDATQGPDADFEHLITQMAEMPLNHLGYVVSAWPISRGRPPAAWGHERVAVLTWFTKDGARPDWLLPWLEAQRAQGGARFLHLGALPFDPGEEAGRPALERWLSPFGLRWEGGYAEGIARVRVTLDRERCAYEADPRRAPVHGGLVSTRPENHVWVTTEDRLAPEATRVGVVVGPWGALALPHLVAEIGNGSGNRRWHLDPFAFFRAALGEADRPAPDPMVRWGRRVFLFHVDGDGFESVSSALPGQISGAVFRREIVERYPIPMTISVIVRSLSDTMTPDAPSAPIAEARRLLSPAHVEAASHGVVHPYDWSQRFTGTAADRVHFAYLEPEGFKYTQIAEATQGLAFVDEHVLEDGKQTRTMLWTGECRPSHEAVEAVTAAGRRNLNGGTFRWDAQWDSVGYVSPFARRTGSTWQIYAGAANEAEFPGFFTTHPAAFGHVEHTIARTGATRILKPANVYAHIYSAENPIRLAVLKRLIERFAQGKPTIPLFASTYSDGVVGALEGELIRRDDGWGFRNMGGCRTLRFDVPVEIDLLASEGVVGYKRRGDSTYVHLAAPTGHVHLGRADPTPIYLEEANHLVEVLRLDATGIRIRSQATHPRVLVFAGLPPKRSVRWKFDDQSRDGFTDRAGRLTIRLPAGDGGEIEVGRH